MTILYVDDDADDRELFSEALRTLNASVRCITAQDGAEALRILESLTEDNNPLPDYIFLDVNMPVMDGRKCLIELKSNHRLSDIPVIVYSTSGLSKDVKEFQNLGADQYMIKHNGFRELMESLSTIIQKGAIIL